MPAAGLPPSSGSIPACAGEPPLDPGRPAPAAVYPRVCGGTLRQWTETASAPGLSPRVRGNRGVKPGTFPLTGSIPACAGEPSRGSASNGKAAVYPRVCGGTTSKLRRYGTQKGLSPRVRGNLSTIAFLPPALGSIPACAGEPGMTQPPSELGGVYPRVCGGTSSTAWTFRLPLGLSPRVRGNHQRTPDCRQERGSIPACAGEPPSPAPFQNRLEVYPRVCGGTKGVSMMLAHENGLSPRVRGNLLEPTLSVFQRRSIPACAGEPYEGAPFLAGRRVYPRVCGGTMDAGMSELVLGGLSPRVRGNRQPCRLPVSLRRSIPACAGEPGVVVPGSAGLGVYPRVCGGTLFSCRTEFRLQGLSPRVRGNPVFSAAWYAGIRSIPACAGEPSATPIRKSPKKVYPRVCGGTVDVRLYPALNLGLSPRVRGNHFAFVWRGLVGRSIPACAGEPPRPVAARYRRWVYPRVCGGTNGARDVHALHGGLSPRVRGNRWSDAPAALRSRSIPACAGEPGPGWMPGTRSRVYPRVCGGTCLAGPTE